MTKKVGLASREFGLFILFFFFFLIIFKSFSNSNAKEKLFIPHRGFTSSLCEDCHRYLADYKGEIADFCFFCHNGSFGQPVSGTFAGSHLHYEKNCLACHSPHLVAGKSPGLLKSKGKTGEDFCFACHYNQTTQTLTFFKNQFNAGVHNFPSPGKSRLSCTNCHLPHSSNSAKMEGFQGQDGFSGEKLCFACHQKIENQFSQVSHHSLANKEIGLECVSCHNPHFTSTGSLSNPENTFLTLGNKTKFCLVCHDSEPPQKAADNSTLVPYSITFPQVKGPFFGGWDKSAFSKSSHGEKNISCLTCHLPHGSTNFSLLGLNGKDRGFEEEKICLSCHFYETTSQSKINDFKKASRHPIEKDNLHRSNEDMMGLAFDPQNSKRHAECYDCHNPHQATAGDPLAGVKGVDLKGNVKNSIAASYELCFKCHTSYTLLSPGTEDLRQSLNPLNPSYHPIVEVGKNSINKNAFNLPYNSESKIDCLDCHGSDTGSRAVHGSKYSPILQRPVEKEEPDSEKSLCFKCHKFTVYKSPSSLTRFPNHSQHSQKFACLICHQAHGSVKPALLQRVFVFNNKSYKLDFFLEKGKGSCQITPAGPCHDQKTYERSY